MSKLTSRSRLVEAVSPLAFGIALCAGSSAAWAQDATTDPNAAAAQAAAAAAQDAAAAAQDAAATAQDQAAQTAPKPDEGAIVVTGFRAALQSATNTKK